MEGLGFRVEGLGVVTALHREDALHDTQSK